MNTKSTSFGEVKGKREEEISDNGIGIMDKVFSSKERIRKLLGRENKFFVLRIKNNMKLEMLDNGKYLIGEEQDQLEVRLVNFCS